MEKGYLQVYTGEGKGKTTAALGLALRALGAGLSVHFGQFIKGSRTSEIAALETLARSFRKADGSPALEAGRYGEGRFIRGAPGPADIRAAHDGLAAARAAMLSGSFDLVILDEFNVALSIGLFGWEDAAALIDARPAGVELVLTGRGAPPALVERADLVTEMREIKHYYARGVQARTGIED